MNRMKCRHSLLLVAALLAPSHAMADPRGVGGPPEPTTPEAIEARRVQLVADMKAWMPRLVGRFRYEGVVDLNGDPESIADKHSEQFRAQAKGPLAMRLEATEEEETETSGPGKFEGEVVSQQDCGAGHPTLASRPVDLCKIKRAHGVGDCIAIGTGPGVHCVIDVTWEGVGELAGAVIRGEEPFLSPAMLLYGIDANAASIRYLQLDQDGLTETESAVIKGDTLRWVFYTGEGKETRRVTSIRAPPDGNIVQTAIEIEKLTPSGWRLLASIVFDGRRVAPDADADGS